MVPSIQKHGWHAVHRAYADSASIPDSETGCGIIPLAGAVIEVFSHSATYYTIRITTATTTSVSGALTNAEFIYVFNGTAYSPDGVVH